VFQLSVEILKIYRIRVTITAIIYKNSLKILPDDGRITAEMRIGASL
jgi:hypothetical protein